MTKNAAAYSEELIGGTRLRVARWRWNLAETATPLLFFNGLGMAIETIAPFVAALAERPVIAYDMPGTGRSPDPLLPYNAAATALQARELLLRFGVQRADVCGLSWGGGIAQQFALQHRAMVRRLVLMATGAGLPAVPGSPEALLALGDGPLRGQRSATPLGYACQIMALACWTSAPLLPFVSAPALILVGDHDRVVPPANGHILHGLLPGSRLETIEGGGHLFLLTHTERTARAVRSFLEAPDVAPETRKAA